MSSEFAEPRGKPFLTFPPSPTYFLALIHVGHLFLDFLGQIQPEKIHFEGHTPGCVCRRPLLHQVSLWDGAASWCLSLPPRRKATGRQRGFQEVLGDSGHAEKVLGAWLVPSLCAPPSCPMAGEGLPHGDLLLWLVSPRREVLM